MRRIRLLTLTSFIISLSFISCSESIVSECEPDMKVDNQMRASFKEIQEQVFTPSCATSGCHTGSFSYFPNLEEEQSFENIVGKNNLSGNMPLIDPGNSSNSYLFKKLLGEAGSLMPLGGQKLNQNVLDSIAAWIDNGAENN